MLCALQGPDVHDARLFRRKNLPRSVYGSAESCQSSVYTGVADNETYNGGETGSCESIIGQRREVNLRLLCCAALCSACLCLSIGFSRFADSGACLIFLGLSLLVCSLTYYRKTSSLTSTARS